LSETLKPSTNLHGDAPAVASPQGLADRKELASVAVERTRMPMVVTNPREEGNPIVLANKAFLDLTGYAAEEIIGRNCRFLQGPGSSEAAIAEIRAALADERELNVEILNYRKNGTTFWNQLRLCPVHGDDGNSSTISALRTTLPVCAKSRPWRLQNTACSGRSTIARETPLRS
jgi:PAS domain S-box-containing protein